MRLIYLTSGNERAVSPVIGVMLMLVVVIIIAAVVSGLAGGMIGTSNQKAPTLVMDVKIVNMGSWVGSGFFATVTAVSEPIPTKDLRIVTSWASSKGGKPYKGLSGGNTTSPGVQNINVLGDPATTPPLSDGLHVAPFGTGPGINGSATIGSLDTNPTYFSGPGQQFGNYTLMPGTTLTAQPCGAKLDHIGGAWTNGNPGADYGYGVQTLFIYRKMTGMSATTYYLDPISAVLGPNWQYLQMGDTVNVKVIHIPTGKVIFQRDIPVTEE